MPVELEISVSDSVDDAEEIPDAALLQRWAEPACDCVEPVVTSMRIVGSAEMQALNREWRGIDRPTNVLSFPMETPSEIDVKLLGDIVLCAEVIREEAAAQHKSTAAHWAHMVVHGMLHLQGHDHDEDEDAAIMEGREIHILRQLGFDDPYHIPLSTEQAR